MAAFQRYVFPVSSSSASSTLQPMPQPIEPFENFLMRLASQQAGKKDIVGYIRNLMSKQDAKQLLDIRQRLKTIAL